MPSWIDRGGLSSHVATRVGDAIACYRGWMTKWVILLALCAIACSSKTAGGAGESGDDWRWKLAAKESKVAYGSGQLVIKGDLPTGWDQKEYMGGIRLAMPEQNGMVFASIEIAPAPSAGTAKELAAVTLDPSYTIVDGPKEIIPGRWSRVFLEPGGMSKDRVRYDAAVYWEVGGATMRCQVRIVGPKDPAVWVQALDTCKAIQATVPS